MHLFCLHFLFDQLHIDVFGIERPGPTDENIHDDARNEPENISKNGRNAVKSRLIAILAGS